MTRQKVYPTFHFFPTELHEEAERVAKKYKHGDKVSEAITRIYLPKLLKQIRALEDNEQVVLEFARTLKNLHINILATEYPYEREDKSTIYKIVLILIERYTRIVGRRFWLHFQQLPFDDGIKRVLRHSFHHEDNNFLGLKEEIRQKYKMLFSSDQLLDGLALEIGKERRTLKESFSDWKVATSIELEKELWKRILKEFIKYDWFIDRQGEDTVEQKLENAPLAEYKQIIGNYLEAFEFNDFHTRLLEQVIDRLADPRDNISRWKGVPHQSIEKVKKWLYKRELYGFLDYERFDYWEKYLRKITDLEVVSNPPVAAMYFGDFVVLEFAEIGNAAYFYETEGFKKFLAPKLISNVSETSLKDRDAHFYIHKLSHVPRNRWYARFDEFMAAYLRGQYWYTR